MANDSKDAIDDEFDDDEDDDDELDEDEEIACAIEGVEGFFSRADALEGERLAAIEDWVGFGEQVEEPNAHEIVLNYLGPSSFEKFLQPIRRLLKQEVYKIDRVEGVLWRSGKRFGLVSQKKICSLDELCGVAVCASFKQIGNQDGFVHHDWWEYGISLVRDNGEVIHVLQRHQLPFLWAVHDAKLLAAKLGLNLYPAHKERYLKVAKTSAGVKIEYVEPKWSDYLRDFAALLSFKD